MKSLLRKYRLLGAICILSLAGLVACKGSDPEPQPRAWFEPDCETIQGPPVVTWSPDGGQSIRPSEEPFPVDIGEGDRTERTHYIAALRKVGGVLFAVQSGSLYRSEDAGCQWEQVAVARYSDAQFSDLVATDLWAFALNRDDDSELYRIHPDGTVKELSTPAFDARDLAESADDPEAIYVLERDGTIWRGGRYGREWSEQATVPFPVDSIGDLGINPHDSRHFVVSGFSKEVMVSFDGGGTWLESDGIGGTADTGGTFAIGFSKKAPGQDVWVNAVLTWDSPDGTVEERRTVIVHSVDGGQTFRSVVTDGEEVSYNDRTPLETRSGVGGEVLFRGDGCPYDTPKLHIYSSVTDSVTTFQYEPGEIYGIETLQSHPTNADIIYIGQDASFAC